MVEIRKGYGLKHLILWGTIQNVIIENSYKEIFDRIPFNLIIPCVNSLEEAIISVENILGIIDDTEELICFNIKLN